MTKPKIKVDPIDEADYLAEDLKRPGLNWAYCVSSPYDENNKVTGAMAGTKTTATEKAKAIGKRFLVNVEAMRKGRAAVNMGAGKAVAK